ncbi:hypothetical protein D3C84_809210 [compost metagenome]
MYTGAWLRASLSICLRKLRMGKESPSRRRSMTPPGAGRSRALLTSSRKRLRSTGLVRKSKAPALSALIAVSTLPYAVIMATGVWGKRCWMCCTSSRPVPSGRRMSVRHRSKVSRLSRARASLASRAL